MVSREFLVWRGSYASYIAVIIEPLDNYAHHWQHNRIVIDEEGELFTYVIGKELTIDETIIEAFKCKICLRVENWVYNEIY